MRVIEPEVDEQIIHSRWITPIAILIIVLGLVAIAFPFFAAAASTLIFGWVFILAGIAQIAYAFQSRGSGQIAWKLILGSLYLLSGIFVIVNPIEGMIIFTLILGITIFLQGIIQVSLAFQVRRISTNWVWILVSGIMGIIFGIFVGSIASSSAAWLIGTLIGINLLFDGVWMLTLHSGQQRT